MSPTRCSATCCTRCATARTSSSARCKFPSVIHHHQGDDRLNPGHNALEVQVNAVQANAPVQVLTPPDSAKVPPMSVATVESQKLAEGVWYVGGIRHASVAVEFRDFVAVVEAPLNEKRSIAVIDEVLPARAEEADPLSREHAPSLRPRGRPAHVRGRRGDDRYPSNEPRVLREGGLLACSTDARARSPVPPEPRRGAGSGVRAGEPEVRHQRRDADARRLPGAGVRPCLLDGVRLPAARAAGRERGHVYAAKAGRTAAETERKARGCCCRPFSGWGSMSPSTSGSTAASARTRT